MKRFTADFETIVDESDCRVWAYAISEIGNIDNFIHGNNIEDFINWCANPRENYQVWFHNLKFDGEYIFSYLLNNGFTCIKTKKERANKTFTTVISDMGQFYSIEIYFEIKGRRINKVTIYDSFKVLAFSVDKIAKDFNLPIRKLKIDYKEYREVGHILTDEEVDYIRNDVEIMSMALDIMFKRKLTKMTIGGDALKFYKSNLKYFHNYYPELPFEIDADIRKSYKGGFTYLNPLYKEKEVENGIVLDVNSLYPSVMMEAKLPFGQPLYFDGEYKKDILYPLYIQRLSCSFKVKKGMIPTIQIKGNLSFLPNEYLESSNDEIVTLTLTNIDLDLFFKHYEVKYLIYQGGWKFKQIRGLFDEYINYWSEQKITAKKENNPSLYKISKLMLNSLYGKFAKNPVVRSKYPYLDDEGVVRYNCYPAEVTKGLYIPTGTFITAYARYKTITTSQKIRDYTKEKYGVDYYIYSDTDSIHMRELPEEELKQFIEIDDYNLGWWKLESRFKKGKFIRQKCYIEEDYDEELNVTVAGLPKNLGKYINFDNFNIGFSITALEDEKDHKLTYKHVKGGVMLVDTDFTIK